VQPIRLTGGQRIDGLGALRPGVLRPLGVVQQGVHHQGAQRLGLGEQVGAQRDGPSPAPRSDQGEPGDVGVRRLPGDLAHSDPEAGPAEVRPSREDETLGAGPLRASTARSGRGWGKGTPGRER
jgi:hypothetical protein